MILIAFLAPAAFWPFLPDASSAPKWAVLGLTLPLLLLFRPWTRWHALCGAFLGWCVLQGLWASSLALWAIGLWHAGILACAFLLAPKDMKGCVYAFAAGVAVSGFLAVPQYLGWTGLPQAVEPAGLMMNKNYLAEAGLMALVGVLIYARKWGFLLVPPLLFALVLPVSRGALLAAGMLGAAWLWQRSRMAAVVCLCLAVGFVAWQFRDRDPVHSDVGSHISLAMNGLAMFADQPFGRAWGGYWADYPLYNNALRETTEKAWSLQRRPRTAHNDGLTLLVEVGAPGVLLLALAVGLAATRQSSVRWILAAFLCLGLFNFPAFTPATAFLAALCLGHLCRYQRFDGRPESHERGVLLSGHVLAGTGRHGAGVHRVSGGERRVPAVGAGA